MSDFDFKTQFPISEYINGVINKKKIEEESRIRGNQAIIEGIMSIGDAANTFKSSRDSDAQALARANILAQSNPELLKAFDTQVSTRQVPGTMPEGVEGPVPLVQKPIMKSEIQGGREQITKALAGAIKGISGDKFLDYIKPESETDKALKRAKAESLLTPKEGKPQIRQNAFTGEWEWYYPPNSDGNGKTANAGKDINQPRGTFRDVSKALGDAGENKAITDSVISELDRITPLNKNSRGGFVGGLIQKGQSAANYKTDSPEFKNTADVINTLKGQVSKVLKSTFGGQLSDSERGYLNEVYGAVENMSPVERAIAIKNVQSTIRVSYQRYQSKLNALRGVNSPRDNGGKGSNEDPLGIRGL